MSAFRTLGPLVIATAATVSGCSALREPPVSPAVPMPTQYRSEAPASPAVDHAARVWWQALGDARLDALVERAMAANPDLEVATARIAAARSELGRARSLSRPQVDLTATRQREQMSRNGLFGAASQGGVLPGLYDQYQVGIDASWEWDLFGADAALRNSARAAIAEAQADRDARMLSVSAEVASLYVEHVAVSQQTRAVHRAIEAATRRVQLADRRAAMGDLADLEVLALRMQLEALNAKRPVLEARRESLRHAMGILIGSGEYVELPEEAPVLERATVALETAVPTGLPSDLLRRRPDLRSAEARYRGAFAELQHAIADFYPRFAVQGSLGRESLRSGDLFNSGSVAWTLLGAVSAPLLDGGRRAAVRDHRQAELDAAIAAYRGEVIKALADVEQALLARRAAYERLVAEESRLAESRRAVALQQSRVKHGDATLAELGEAEQAHEAVLSEVLDARQNALASLIRLHKALGGPA